MMPWPEDVVLNEKERNNIIGSHSAKTTRANKDKNQKNNEKYTTKEKAKYKYEIQRWYSNAANVI